LRGPAPIKPGAKPVDPNPVKAGHNRASGSPPGWVVLPLCLLVGCAGASLEGGPFSAPDAGPAGLDPRFDRVVVMPDDRTVVDPVQDPFEGSCGRSTIRAQALPVDLVVMMDASGSMKQRTSSGETKWEAVTGAFDQFFRTQGAGLSVGLQFFPLTNRGAVRDCSTDAGCGIHGPCDRFKVCVSSGKDCLSDADCGGSECALVGRCQTMGGYCAPAGGSCSTNAGDSCTALPGRCRLFETCDVNAYSSPKVPVTALPGGAAALSSAMRVAEPDGATPTGPALSGALAQAAARLKSEPSRRAAVVLATDGFPTSCSPQGIRELAQIAAGAFNATPSVATYVIGVFSPQEASTAASNLNQIAVAGGSDKAIIVDTGTNVSTEFLRALNAIRFAALACEYQLSPDPSGLVDFGQVNVRHVNASNKVAYVPYVGIPFRCDSARGGWYFDVDPAMGVPTQVRTCPATCSLLRSDPGGRVDLIFGCKTIVID